MTRVLDVGRALALAILGALLGAASLVVGYAVAPDLVVSMDNEAPPIVSGLFPVERTPDGQTFAWSHDVIRLYLPGLDRQHPWTLHLRFRAPRPDVRQLPDVTVEADGIILSRIRGANEPQELTVTLPTNPGLTRGARIVIRSSNTFVPGPTDTRKLGLQVDDIRLRRSTGVPIVPRQAIAAAALGAATFGALFGLIGLTAGSAAIAAGAVACGQAAAMVTGAGPFTPYASQAPLIAAWIALGTLVIVWTVERVRGQRLRNTARFVAAFSSAVLFLKLLVLLHPDMPIGDALFQAHRFEWVRDGRWFFTSIAPGGYQFPYAIGLYVAALPFMDWVQGTAGFMLLLRVLVAITDVIAGVLIYPMVVKPTGERLAGAIAVGLFHLLPLNFQVQTVGNLTNAFGQSLFTATLALIVIFVTRQSFRTSHHPASVAPGTSGERGLGDGGHPGRRDRGWTAVTIAGWIGLMLVAAAAMLSHTSTFAIAAPVLMLVAHMFWWHGAPAIAPRAWPLVAITAGAALVSVIAYYGHFGETYAAQFARITGELGRPAAQSDPGGRSIAQRALMVPYYLNEYYGWSALVLTSGGVAALAGRRDPLTMTIWGWLAGTGAFLLLGVFTPVDFRHYLAAFPAVAILAAFGAARAWVKGPFMQAFAIVLLVASLIIGVRHWLAPLG